MSKQGINHSLAVRIELAHLCPSIAFGHNSQVDALSDIGVAIKGAISGCIVTFTRLVSNLLIHMKGLAFPDVMVRNSILAYLADKYIVRVNNVGELSDDLTMKVNE